MSQALLSRFVLRPLLNHQTPWLYLTAVNLAKAQHRQNAARETTSLWPWDWAGTGGDRDLAGSPAPPRRLPSVMAATAPQPAWPCYTAVALVALLDSCLRGDRAPGLARAALPPQQSQDTRQPSAFRRCGWYHQRWSCSRGSTRRALQGLRK